MATNMVYSADGVKFLSLYVGDDVLSGTPVRVGGIVGVTQTDSLGGLAANGMHSSQEEGWATVATRGSAHVPVAVTSGQAVASGASGTAVYIDDDGKLSLVAPTPADGDDPAVNEDHILFGYVLDDELLEGTASRVHVVIAARV